VLLARDGIVISIFFLEDKIAPDARESLLQLRQQGHRLAILSGDRALTVSAVAATLRGGVEDLFEFVVGDCSPEDKLARIRALVRAGKTPVMVGDGINDAAALSAARVGVAVSGAAEACQLSSDIFVASAGVSHLRGLFEGAARLRRTIRRGVVFSLCYNLIGVSLAAFGFLGPLGAAILMPLSSLTVISHAMRSRIFPASSDSP
jgi:P-type E1-E2 ATPase